MLDIRAIGAWSAGLLGQQCGRPVRNRPVILLAALSLAAPCHALDPLVASNLVIDNADGIFSGPYPDATTYFYPQCVAAPFTLAASTNLSLLTFWGSSDNTVSSRLANVRRYEIRIYDETFTTPALQFSFLRGSGVTETLTQRINTFGGEEYEVRVPLSGTLPAGTWFMHVGARLIDPDGDAWMWTNGARKGLRFTSYTTSWSAWANDNTAGLAFELRGTPDCPADLDKSGQVDMGDVALAMLEFGPCVGCTADLDGTGQVDFSDVALLLLDMGPCS